MPSPVAKNAQPEELRSSKRPNKKPAKQAGRGIQEVAGGLLPGAGGAGESDSVATAGFLRGRPRWPGATRRLAVCARLAMKLGPPNAHWPDTA